MTADEPSHFSLLDLIGVLKECEQRFPLARLAKAGNATGNMVVYDADGDYVAVIELHHPPELTVFGDDE